MSCLKAYAKINWTLDILGTREDGYHLMDMLMQPVEMHDTLWLEKADAITLESAGNQQCSSSGDDAMSSAVVTYDEKNLVYRAAKLLKERCGYPGGAKMRLEKHIPSGAGMGGGSADAAAALKGLNELWKLGLSQEQLLDYGLKLGADVPFMLTGGLARVGGIGEQIHSLSPAPEIWLVMMQPCGGLSTKEVFTAFDALNPESLSRPETDRAQKALLAQNLRSLGNAMNNVLEGVSVQARPQLKEACEALESAGAVRAMMTGSGSVVYGVFADSVQAKLAVELLTPKAAVNGWGEVWMTHTMA